MANSKWVFVTALYPHICRFEFPPISIKFQFYWENHWCLRGSPENNPAASPDLKSRTTSSLTWAARWEAREHDYDVTNATMSMITSTRRVHINSHQQILSALPAWALIGTHGTSWQQGIQGTRSLEAGWESLSPSKLPFTATNSWQPNLRYPLGYP